MKPIRFSRHFPLLAVLLTTSAAQAQWQTVQTNPPTSLTWVYYNYKYDGFPPNDYQGAWGVPNSWPQTGASVTIRHEITLNNSSYSPTGNYNVLVEPFPGGHPDGNGHPQGLLTVSVLNIVPGGWISSTLEDFSFDGVSTWSGGMINAGAYSPPGVVHNRGHLAVTGPFTLARGGAGMLNTNCMDVSSTFGIQYGGWLTNLSGTQPDPSVAEIVLSNPGAAITQDVGGGGFYGYIANYGVLRKTRPGIATIGVGLENHADSVANRAGTVAVDEGTLILEPASATSHLWGLKAEIAPTSLLILRGSHDFENGDTTVTGGGVLRFEPVSGKSNYADTGALPTFSAPEGKLECAGADMRNLTNLGSINVTASSYWQSMTNLGHIRMLAGTSLQVAGPSLFNGSTSSHTAVLDLEDDAGFSSSTSSLENRALLRKSGPGISIVNLATFNLYGAPASADSGAIEVDGGTLRFSGSINFDNETRIRVASGAVMELNNSNSQNGGTVHVTGSGKVYLNPGSSLKPTLSGSNVPNPGIIDAAPGTFELRGGQLVGPVTNAGELTVTNPTGFVLSIYTDNPVTNSGTIHCTATSAGTGKSITLGALVRLVCTPTSVLALDIAGSPANVAQWASIGADGHGQSTVAYDGTLRINFGSFTPTAGSRWNVIDMQGGYAPTGDFASVEFTNVPAGFTPTFKKIATGIRVGLDAAATAPVSYASWAAAQNFPTPADAAFDVDFDHDGLSNGAEYALGTDPKSPTGSPATVLRENIGGDEFLAARYTRPGSGDRGPDVQWIGEGSYDLTDWSADKAVMEYGPPDGMGRETVTVRLAEPIAYHPHAFVRLRLVKTP